MRTPSGLYASRTRTRGPICAYQPYGPRPRAGSRRAGCAARAASGRRPTRPPRRARAPPSASSSCCCAPARRRSRFASTASSTSASARSCSTLKKPGPVANSITSFVAHVDARRAGLERRDERRVPRENADLAGGARYDHHLRVAVVRRCRPASRARRRTCARSAMLAKLGIATRLPSSRTP